MPHHITQRGNRRQQTFFDEEGYAAYVELMADWCREEGVAIWAYCLMPNHVDLIAVPGTEQALRRGEVGSRSDPTACRVSRTSKLGMVSPELSVGRIAKI